jgi:hypothetical protein
MEESLIQNARVIDRQCIQSKKLTSGLAPALVTLALMAAVVGSVIIVANGDAMALVQMGSRFENHVVNGTWGYDGQFYYYIARDLNPQTTAAYLDIPAYRYQRILYPLMAHIISFGNLALIPWVMVILSVLAQAMGTWMVAKILDSWGINVWFALVYGMWIGFGLAVRTVMAEPLAFGLVAGAWLANQRGRLGLTWVLLGLSLFAKEVTVGFILAFALDMVWHRRWRHLIGLVLVAGLPYLVFQLWLLGMFGRFGIGSGGAMATPFEIIPYMGLWRVLQNPSILLKVLGVALIPVAVIPSAWGMGASIKKLIALDVNPETLALLINAASLVFLPFSTYHDVRGITRFMCAIAMAIIFFCARYQRLTLLKLSFLWLSLDLLLLLIF